MSEQRSNPDARTAALPDSRLVESAPAELRGQEKEHQRPMPQALATISLDADQNPTGVAVDPEGNLVYVASSNLGNTTNVLWVIDGVTNRVLSSFAVGASPLGVAVLRGFYEARPHTFLSVNHVFVACSADDTLWVFDFSNTSVSSAGQSVSLGAGSQPRFVAVDWSGRDPSIYVTNYNAGTVAVIDGLNPYAGVKATITVPPMNPPPTGPAPWANPHGIAVNPTTGRIYVGDQQDGGLFEFDRATHSVVAKHSFSKIEFLSGLAANFTTGRIYAGRSSAPFTTSRIYMTDGTRGPGGQLNLQPITVEASITQVAVNVRTNRIYATDGLRRVVVIDGTTNNVLGNAPVGPDPLGIAVNDRTNRVYVANSTSNTVSVLAG
ncbi:YncE family protein [Kitasatospora aureofaciens]|uniref:YncE family protein n=1 Tax=Kitasatospora aureofaciens TaxID=1894 RepID=UPI001C447D9D|nr:YncE family protein [Kitasatospora aureofaciens]MBV6703416.1 YncE family protein [Kitasatospora aureofaciens]